MKSSDSEKVLVWDLPVRIFHWSLVLAVVLNYFVLEEGDPPHRYVGYTASALVFLRVIWGFIAPNNYVRFKTFWPSWGSTAVYIKALLKGNPPRNLSHNPLSTWMMTFLCLLILLLALSGWMMSWDLFWGEDWLEDVHEFLANTLIVSAFLHALAAVVEGRRHGENLVASMIHGKKTKNL